MTRKLAPKLIHEQSSFIDPLHCGSKISAQIMRTVWNRITGTVELSDCNRSVKWELWQHDHNDGLKKLDKAIDELVKIRTAWKDAISGKYTAKKRKKKK
jgi:hypothetical protein